MKEFGILFGAVVALNLVACRPEIPVDTFAHTHSHAHIHAHHGHHEHHAHHADLHEFEHFHPLELEYLPVVESAKQFASPQTEYGPPQHEYGPPPQTEYGPPVAPRKIITKSVYIHAPPPEVDEYRHTQILEPKIPKKHYKIIFIKAPTAPTPTVPVIPETIPDEHKTLVYVLVKKPEPQPQIEIPKIRPTEPSKPEVYFIKYKNNAKPAETYGPPAH